MDIAQLEIPDVKVVTPKRFRDTRGHFCESWSDRRFRQEIADESFVQDNRSVSAKRGTLRGLHFQKPPCAQGKLVFVVRGSVFDVAVDIRKGSPTYGQHVAVTLDAAEGSQLWIPPGFLGVLWSDPDLGINWPIDVSSIVLSAKDQQHPRLRDIPVHFHYEVPPRVG
jgi:dTDP-4-dehydrorhamnose 3,5-epimerase